MIFGFLLFVCAVVFFCLLFYSSWGGYFSVSLRSLFSHLFSSYFSPVCKVIVEPGSALSSGPIGERHTRRRRSDQHWGMGDSSDENHVLYIKKFVKQVLAEVKRKQDDALAETCTYVTRVLGRVIEILEEKVRIDDGTGVMDVELLTLKIADSGDAGYAKEGATVSGAKENQGRDPKRVRSNKGPSKFSKAIQYPNFDKTSLIGKILLCQKLVT